MCLSRPQHVNATSSNSNVNCWCLSWYAAGDWCLRTQVLTKQFWNASTKSNVSAHTPDTWQCLAHVCGNKTAKPNTIYHVVTGGIATCDNHPSRAPKSDIGMHVRGHARVYIDVFYFPRSHILFWACSIWKVPFSLDMSFTLTSSLRQKLDCTPHCFSLTLRVPEGDARCRAPTGKATNVLLLTSLWPARWYITHPSTQIS